MAELLIGVVKDPAPGFVITIGAGGIYTELLKDRASLLFPASREQLEQSLTQLKAALFLQGYRNRPPAAMPHILDAIEAIQTDVLANLTTVEEVEVNPLIATPTPVVAVDALIGKRRTDTDSIKTRHRRRDPYLLRRRDGKAVKPAAF